MMERGPDALFENVLIPIASEDDARTARDMILPYLSRNGGVAIVAHVIKYKEGGINPSPVSLQEEDAERLFEIVDQNDTGLVIDTKKAYGTDIAAAIFAVADEIDASAIVFAPAEASRIIRLLTGDIALSLVTDPDVPVLSIPRDDT